MAIEYSGAEAEDIEEILKLERAKRFTLVANKAKKGENQWAKSQEVLADAWRGQRLVVARENGKVVGYGFYNYRDVGKKREAFIPLINVVTESRSKGIGTNLFKFIENRVKGKASVIRAKPHAGFIYSTENFIRDRLGMKKEGRFMKKSLNTRRKR